MALGPATLAGVICAPCAALWLGAAGLSAGGVLAVVAPAAGATVLVGAALVVLRAVQQRRLRTVNSDTAQRTTRRGL